MIRVNLVVQADDQIRDSVQVVKRVANVWELLKALTVLDASHLHERRKGGPILALEHTRRHETRDP